MVAVAAHARLAACHGCAGGGEVNGVECRECAGTGRQRARARAVLAGLRARLHAWSLAAAGAAGTAVRVSTIVPGIAGAAGVTACASVIVHAAWHWVPGYAVALGVGGVFALAADRRL